MDAQLLSPAVFNKRNIVRLIRMVPGISRAEIVKRLSLSTSLVNLYTRELMDGGWIMTTGKFGEKAGRKTNTLEIKKNMARFLCLHTDINGIYVRQVDFAGKVMNQYEVKSELPLNNQAEFLNAITLAVVNAIDKAKMANSVDGIVISANGHIELSHGMAFKINGFKEWDTISIKNVIGSMTDIPLNVISSVSSILYQLMNIDGNSEYILLKINNDLAFGYVNGCQLVKGGIGTAGELSHLRLNVNGDLCKCGGRGCLESIPDEKERWNVLKDLLPGLTKKYNDSKVYLWSDIKQEDLEGASVSLINPSVSEILIGNGHAAAIQFIERRIS